MTVSIDGHGQIYVDHDARNLEQLGSALRELASSQADASVTLQADEGVPYGTVAKAMAAIEHAGVTKLAVLTAGAS